MKPQAPLVFGDSLSNPPGDCFRACIASVIERPCSEVPHFVVECGEQDHVYFARDWLRTQGLDLFETYYPDSWTLDDVLKWSCADNPGLPMILSGHPPGGPPNEGHAVIMMDGRIVYDPGHCGLDGPSECREDAPGRPRWWVYVVCLASNWTEKRKRQ